MSEYTKEELSELFLLAIYEMAEKGILSPDEVKEILKNINKWLTELLET